MCVHSKTLVVAGTAGQVVIFELKDEEVEKELEVIALQLILHMKSIPNIGIIYLTL